MGTLEFARKGMTLSPFSVRASKWSMVANILSYDIVKLRQTQWRLNVKILITGGSGFIGRNLTKRLIQDGHEVTITSTGSEPKIPNVKKVIYLGLTGMDWDQAVGHNAVIHLMANNDTLCSDRSEMLRTNFAGPLKLFDIAAQSGCERFVHASSTAIYGNSPVPYIEGKTEEQPLNVYGESKKLFDDQAAKFAQHYGVKSIGLRYCNIYGPGEEQKGKRMSMIGQILRRMLARKRPRMFKHGEQQRDWVYIHDVVEANVLALQSDVSGTFNIGSGVASTFNEIVGTINALLGTELLAEYIDCPFPNEFQDHTQCNIEKARRKLGFFPGFDLRSGIEDYLSFLVRNSFQEE
jgi:ADP-L-glycero-D-manno-heptose 6-epimerase